MKRSKQPKEELHKALAKLEEGVRVATSELEIDGSIQRCEFTFELFWKTLRLYLPEQGIQADSPRLYSKTL